MKRFNLFKMCLLKNSAHLIKFVISLNQRPIEVTFNDERKVSGVRFRDLIKETKKAAMEGGGKGIR
jgi:hypothetical protein